MQQTFSLQIFCSCCGTLYIFVYVGIDLKMEIWT